jgi:hypothetical protein
MKEINISTVIIFSLIVFSCHRQPQEANPVMFKDDVAFLQNHGKIIVLSDAAAKAQVAVSPAMQGRVLTSTADGPEGLSYGWINRELIASGANNPHMNAFGGEDRFWMGPEGGQFSIFFQAGKAFNLDNWFTPPTVNEQPFEVIENSTDRILFRKNMEIVNYNNFQFNIELDRTVRLMNAQEITSLIGFAPSADIKMVAFESDNTIRNIGTKEWCKETGLLSIWILGMFNPSPRTTVVIPFRPGTIDELGPIVNDAYFGKVPEQRLRIKNNTLFFNCDGQYRSKIGIAPLRCKPFAGSYDAVSKVLTLVHYSFNPESLDYVNSMWEMQKQPYQGDVVNSYNDGPASPGAKPLGPFYELETSSAAAALKPGENLTHIHRTLHFQGPESELEKISLFVLGITIHDIQDALK